MTISIWRYSHLVLAISSSLFIIIASITGIILAFEPISNQLKPYAIENTNTISLAKTIAILNNEYKEVVSLEIDNNNFVSASIITKKGQSKTFYINPFTGKNIGNIIEKDAIYRFATNLHRSLFLKATGRFIIGFVSFLLLLITLTGIVLITKRQGGIKRFFNKVIKEDFEQYYHVVIARYTLIPIVILTVTGIYLSLEKFSLLPSDHTSHNIKHIETQDDISFPNEFKLFKEINLNELNKLEFPFSKDKEDYFFLELKDKEIYVNQYTGNIVSEKQKPFVTLASELSFILHTGQGSIIWSLLLLLSCLAILFFIYSGFSMTLKRKNKSPLAKNRFNKDEAEYIILVGSETGNTFELASIFFNALITNKKRVHLSELNNYNSYKKAKHLIIFTSTYGEGEPPENAKKFIKLLKEVNQENTLKYSVLGFGSLAYPDFCKYAILVDALLQAHPKFTPNLLLHKIHNQSFETFKNWIYKWNLSTGLSLEITSPSIKKNKSTALFTVVERSAINKDQSFLLRLKPNKKTKFTSGDLLSIYPKNDFSVERLYSIGKLESDILLSIKKHEFGICSNYLNKLNINDMVTAAIKDNNNFHFPNHAKSVVMIANGTGIAPFLGMINENTQHTKTHLFWGGRTQDSFKMYSNLINKAYNKKTLSSFNIAYSQEEESKAYVQDLILEKATLISKTLEENGIIMICGSIAMQNGVLEILENITNLKLNKPLSTFQDNEQIKMDCY